MINKFLSLTTIVLLVATVSCKNKQDDKKPTTTPLTVVDVLVASAQKISNTVEVNGTVVAAEYVELHPEVSGRLTYLNVPEGSRIEKGTLMAKINDADLQAQIAKTKVLLELAQKTEERYRKLLSVNGINQADYDAILNQVNGYKADLVYTQALIDKTVVKAPFSGIVGLRQISPGAFVTTASIIATIQQVDKLKVDLTIPETYAKMLHKGNTIDVVLDNGTGAKQKATILAVEPQANLATRNLKVRAILDNGRANPGGFVKAYLDAGDDNNAVLIPTNCLIPDDKNNQVIVIKGGKAEFIPVKTGVRQANLVEITDGVKAGDTVVVTGVLFARPKAKLKIRSVKQLKDLNPQ
ncbi:efflux RND transporter periplasmic adaptor subunit [Parasediminibacterium paludis]|uniref:Efflux RND transporter periplasmic adaptor subunit n=1 Tax=Parasediminibacterium paludis TaxID=908966 RepID=A0ABV8PY99_9BACT